MKPSMLVFAGSSRQHSLNKRLAQRASATAQKLGFKADFIDLKDYPMPLYDGDLEQAQGIPEKARELEALIQNYDVVIIASPEYNGAFTPLLKNTIDWVSRIDMAFLKSKTIALMSVTPGGGGGARGLALLRAWLENMRLSVVSETFTLPKAREAFVEGGLVGEKGAELEQFVANVGTMASNKMVEST